MEPSYSAKVHGHQPYSPDELKINSDDREIKARVMQEILSKQSVNHFPLNFFLKNVSKIEIPLEPMFPSHGKTIQVDFFIRQVTTSLYLSRMSELMSSNILEVIKIPCLSSVILPLLYSKNLLLRIPMEAEAADILDHIYEEDALVEEEKIIQLIAEQKANSIDRLMVLTDGKNPKELLGSIHYEIKEGCCHIISLKVKTEQRDKGYGRLLLCYAMTEAQEKQCELVSLVTTAGSEGFYQKMGFMPQEFKGQEKEWNDLNTEKQLAILQQLSDLFFNLIDKENRDRLNKNLHHVIKD